MMNYRFFLGKILANNIIILDNIEWHKTLYYVLEHTENGSRLLKHLWLIMIFFTFNPTFSVVATNQKVQKH